MSRSRLLVCFGWAVACTNGDPGAIDTDETAGGSTTDGVPDGSGSTSDGPSETDAPRPECEPETCESLGAECGSVPDGCDVKLQCGECSGPFRCGASEPNRCGCLEAQPEDFVALDPLSQVDPGTDWFLFGLGSRSVAIHADGDRVSTFVVDPGQDAVLDEWPSRLGGPIDVHASLDDQGELHVLYVEGAPSVPVFLRQNVFHTHSPDATQWTAPVELAVPAFDGPTPGPGTSIEGFGVTATGVEVLYWVNTPNPRSEGDWEPHLQLSRYGATGELDDEHRVMDSGVISRVDFFRIDDTDSMVAWPSNLGSGTFGNWCIDDGVTLNLYTWGVGTTSLPGFPRIEQCGLEEDCCTFSRPRFAKDDRNRLFVIAGHDSAQYGFLGVQTERGIVSQQLDGIVSASLALDEAGGVHILGLTAEGVRYFRSSGPGEPPVSELVWPEPEASSLRISAAASGELHLGLIDRDGRIRVSADGRWCPAR